MTNAVVKRSEVNLEALDNEIRALLGTNFSGVSFDGEEIILHFGADAPSAQIAEALRLAETHNPTRLTPRQQMEIDRKTRLEELRRANAKTLDLAEYEAAPSEIRQLAEKIAWLELELAERQ